MSPIFIDFIMLWTFILITLVSIGGFFMFRKFLKTLPKSDGQSVLDWQNHYIDKTRKLWSNDNLAFLEDLVTPVPSLFRDVAREKIAGEIGRLALMNHAREITPALIIEGYIKATPKRDHKFLIRKLKENKIDMAPYQHFFEI